MKPTLIATVFGGTGFVGHAVVQALVQQGYTVRIPTRDLEKAKDLKVLGALGQVIPFRTSVRTDMGVVAAIRGADLVINLIGQAAQNKKNTFQTIHVEIAARIARVAKSEKVQTFIHFSALGATVKSSVNFMKTKALGEAAVKAFFPHAVIFRPSVIFGPRDRFLNKLSLFMRHIFFVPLVSGGQARFQPIYVGDVAQAVVNASILPHAQGQTYALTGPDVYSVKELWGLLERLMEKKRWQISVPIKLLYMKAFFLELWFWPPFTRDHIDLLKGNWVYNPNEVQSIRSLGIRPQTLEAVWPSYLITQK